MTLVATSAKSSGSTASTVTMIQDTTVVTPAASFSFPAIAQTYNSLRLVVVGRTTAAVASENARVQFNGDTGANYDWEQLQGLGTTASVGENFADTSILIGFLPGGSATASVFSGCEALIPNYAGAVGQKSLTSVSALKRGTAAAGNNMFATVLSGFWRNTAAITSLVVVTPSNLVVGSRLTLYGIS